MLYIQLFIEREKNIGQSAPECPFKRAFKYGFCTSVHTIDVNFVIAEKADRSLFVKMAGSQHCLHTLFPDIKPYSCRL